MTLMHVTELHLEQLFKAANFKPPTQDMVIVGLRGCIPVEAGGTGFEKTHALAYMGVDHLHMRCTLVQWKPGAGFAVFPGSTVPYLADVKAAMKKGGAGVNTLALGYYAGPHSYGKGDHAQGKPKSRHRALRNESLLPVWRTADDADYDSEDRLEPFVAYDNIHCAWQQNVAAPNFSSHGCQVVAGRPRVAARNWPDELGPWAKFVDAVYGSPQKRFNYALFSGREVLATTTLPEGSRRPTVRFGSTGDLVKAVQGALKASGYDLHGESTAGVFGHPTLKAVRHLQAAAFGPASADGIVGPQTATALGIAWP